MRFDVILSEHGKHWKYIRLPPPEPNFPYTLRFTIPFGSDVLHQDGCCILKTNCPADSNLTFDRKTFFIHEFKRGGHGLAHDSFCDIIIHKSGSYQFFVDFEPNGGHQRKSNFDGYFVVDPLILIKPRSKLIMHYQPQFKTNTDPLLLGDKELLCIDSICLLTVVPKWIGPIEEWKSHFDHISKSGYNMVHFVPIQKRGSSNSPYSIFEQLQFSDDLFSNPDHLDDCQREILMKKELQRLENDNGLLCMTDIVWNHTSFDSEWLKFHPESGYNLVNSPHLRPAYELDEGIQKFSSENCSNRVINTIDDVEVLLQELQNYIVKELKLWEFYVLDIGNEMERFPFDIVNTDNNLVDFSIVEDFMKLCVSNKSIGHRFGKFVDVETAYRYFSGIKIKINKECYKKLLELLNLKYYQEYDSDIQQITRNLRSRIIYERIAEHGPKLGSVSDQNPLVGSYFTKLKPDNAILHVDKDCFILANNGWIWNADPLIDFASSQSKAYLLREVIPWGDCVKLRYGKSKDDSPYLWKRMEQYTSKLAELFHGFRIDNCHSTPIHVAEHLLDVARTVRPNLYVIAELFTGSEESDIIFVSRLGINSLIREAMSAWNAYEMSRIIHKYGGQPIGSLKMNVNTLPYSMMYNNPDNRKSLTFVHGGSTPHALFMDCTHDNETPSQKRTPESALSNAAMVAMSTSAVGSVKGYDELIPKLLNIVTEDRKFKLPDQNSGITPVKAFLMDLHFTLSQRGYTEIHVHQEGEMISISRQHPFTHHGYVLIAHTGFVSNSDQPEFCVTLRNSKYHVSLCSRIRMKGRQNQKMNDKFIEGLDCFLEYKFDHLLDAMIYEEVGYDDRGSYIKLRTNRFSTGSILIIETSLEEKSEENLSALRENLGVENHGNWITDDIRNTMTISLKKACSSLNIEELNVALFRTDNEERDFTIHHGVYHIPGMGNLSYCGLFGWIFHLNSILRDNNLGHPLCSHLREGLWPALYIVERLERYLPVYPNLTNFTEWLKNTLNHMKDIPYFLRPKYFSLVVRTAYEACVCHFETKLINGHQILSQFTRNLVLVSIQLYGYVPSTGLSPVKSKIACLAAGLPHFSTHHMRCWGRDVFISLKGLFMITGQFDIAKKHIIYFASCLKHGLIPNLLDSGRNPRYNARDAVWFFLQAIQDYCNLCPNGVDILDEMVKMRFYDDEFVEYNNQKAYKKEMSIRDIIYLILKKHLMGIDFVEWNAGSQLDHAMSKDGFNVKITFDEKTGFIYGGNRWNCGTWMDKMGDSVKAGIKGVPSTPRDGAAIEIIGLLKSTIRWLLQLSAVNLFPNQIEFSGTKMYLEKWNELLLNSFEKYFYIPEDYNSDHDFVIDPKLVKRRGMYKDTFNSSLKYTDYQLRPNFAIAMSVAPELFNVNNAKKALSLANDLLLGPLGMKTLDPEDIHYRGFYDNANDSNDPNVAHGSNYHQGPEWLWVTGFYLKSLQIFNGDKDHTYDIYLKQYRQVIEGNSWGGLPELTNENGNDCQYSCLNQAWSSATLLDFINSSKSQ